MTGRLHPADVEAIARRVVDLLEHRPPAEPTWLTAADVAHRFGVARSWVYEHAGELGAVRLGDAGAGRRPRLRFDPDRVAAGLASGPSGRRPHGAETPTATRDEIGRARHDRPSGARSLPDPPWEPLA